MISEIANETLDLALKYTDLAEVYIEKEKIFETNIRKDKVDFSQESSTIGIGVRVILDGKIGFSYTTNLKQIERTIENAIFNAKANVIDENFSFASKAKYPNIKNVYDKKIEVFEANNSIEFAKIMIETALDEKCEPTSGGFSAGYSETFVTNSLEINCKNLSTSFSGFISVNFHDKKDLSTASESDSSRFFDLDPKWIAKSSSKIAKSSIKVKSIETKDIDVILDYHAISGLLGVFVSALNADNVQRGRSVFCEKMDQEVLGKSLTIYDDSTLAKGLYSAKCDGEGTPAQKTLVIDKGILKSFLYDIYTSNKGKVKSTANGFRPSFADTPSIGPNNFILEFDDFISISDIKEGIIVTDVLGAHTANPISGDFSVETINAFKIERGEVKYPIKKAMLSGNIFQSMQNCSAISRETRQMGPFIIPRILIPNLRVVA
jgi:PmbA protein